MDLRAIIRSSTAYNFHAHTQWCDGRDTLESIARAAADAGYKHFGFTPHSPVPIESPCNMSADDLEAYRQEVEVVGKNLEDRIKLYRGVEIDYLGPQWGPASRMFAPGNFDFSIGSVHFIPNREGELIDIDGRFERFKERMQTNFNNDIRYVVRTFYDQSHAMLDAGGFDILGHFDKISQNASYYKPGIEDEEWYKRLLNDYIDHVIASGVIVEINTKAREQHGRFFPHESHWERLLDAGVDFAVNSDAHYANRVTASREEAFGILNAIRSKKL